MSLKTGVEGCATSWRICRRKDLIHSFFHIPSTPAVNPDEGHPVQLCCISMQ
jgi:hypothetical protein